MNDLSLLDRVLKFCLHNRLVVVLSVLMAVFGGLLVAPFDWDLEGLPRDPVPVDAIPDTAENQQIVFTEWMGRSPQDMEDQVTYPLTVALLGVPGVETIRSNSMMGFSSIHVIFKEDVEFYWGRSRILEKLQSLPRGTLPSGVQPALGPDATPLGQVFWYTLEGRDEQGRPTGGWDLQELRSIQDWHLRYGLAAVDGVAEVASIGGFVREYQIDVDPDALTAHGVTLDDVFGAIRASNVDVGARTIEINRVEYVVRGLGFVKGVEDLERAVVAVRDNVPVLVRHVAKVGLGPALRRGALDKAGAEAVGGVVVVRYGANPLAVIEGVKAEIARLAPGLPAKTLDDGTVSRVSVVPFYDRSGLIHETLDTLNDALWDEILVTVLVVVVMVAHLRSAALISLLLPLAVLMCFLAMKGFGVDANVVALSGIAIAIGTMVDMGVVLTENILRHLNGVIGRKERLQAIFDGASEVGGAVLTAVLTTVVSFLPVFTMTGQEGKLFKPLAFTKTFALLAAIVVALMVIPPLARTLMGGGRTVGAHVRKVFTAGRWALLAVVLWVLATHWEPIGPDRDLGNLLFAFVSLGGVLYLFHLFQQVYEPILRFCLRHKLLFLSVPTLLCLFGLVAWLGAKSFLPGPHAFGDPKTEKTTAAEGWSAAWHALDDTFPGLKKTFMPPLDEGSFLLMPIVSPHASIGEAMDVLSKQDRAIRAIPEVEQVVGKIGRVESALDPAPIGMIETVITYKPEFILDEAGDRERFAFDEENGVHRRDESGLLISDPDGRPYRVWRDHIRSPDDIWKAIAAAAKIPGATTPTKLQPIKTRQIMLQTGMRALMGVKVQGPDLETIETVARDVERLLRRVPQVDSDTVNADRVVGKPYLEIVIDRDAIARHGLSIRKVQDVIEVAMGGKIVTTTVEGRERYPVRVRYLRELRDQIEEIDRILVPAPDGTRIPLGQLSDLRYERGPQMIKSEDTLLTAYVTFGKRDHYGDIEVVQACQDYLEEHLQVPTGVRYRFTGEYENHVRAEQKLKVVLPVALFLIFLLLYLQFRRVSTSLLVFSGVFVAWAGGFLLLWLYGQGWFLNVEILGTNLRDVFQVGEIQLTVAVWVGFLALFGIATDDGVVMGTYLEQSMARAQPRTVKEVREAVVLAGKRRIRPCLMTSATTILALLPVLTSTGRGADVMIPMAIPSFGGMTVVLLTVFVVPTLYSWLGERRVRRAVAQEIL